MMEEKKHTIVGIHVPNRYEHATEVQKILTEYGCSIKTRVGLHEVEEEYCAMNGLILLEVVEMLGEAGKAQNMVDKLKNLENLDVQTMVFKH
jgi:hypothetical protein